MWTGYTRHIVICITYTHTWHVRHSIHTSQKRGNAGFLPQARVWRRSNHDCADVEAESRGAVLRRSPSRAGAESARPYTSLGVTSAEPTRTKVWCQLCSARGRLGHLSGKAPPPPRYLRRGVGVGGASQVLLGLHGVDTLVRELLWRVACDNGALASTWCFRLSSSWNQSEARRSSSSTLYKFARQSWR